MLYANRKFGGSADVLYGCWKNVCGVLRRSDNVSCSLVPFQDDGTDRVTQPFLHFKVIAFHAFSDRSLASLCTASRCNRGVLGSIECWGHTHERSWGLWGIGAASLKAGKMNIWNKKIFRVQQFLYYWAEYKEILIS